MIKIKLRQKYLLELSSQQYRELKIMYTFLLNIRCQKCQKLQNINLTK